LIKHEAASRPYTCVYVNTFQIN